MRWVGRVVRMGEERCLLGKKGVHLEDGRVDGDNTKTDLNSVNFPCISFTIYLKPIRYPYLILHILLLILSATCFGSLRTILRETYRGIYVHLFLLSQRTQQFKHYAFLYLLQHISAVCIGHFQVESL